MSRWAGPQLDNAGAGPDLARRAGTVAGHPDAAWRSGADGAFWAGGIAGRATLLFSENVAHFRTSHPRKGTMQEYFRPCPICEGWTLDSWSGVGGPCTRCYLTTMTLLERFETALWPRWRRWIQRVWQDFLARS